MPRTPSIARILALSLVLAACGDDDEDDAKPVDVVVMTRNVFLGADLGPAIGSQSVSGFVAATGGILRQVTATDFATRAKGLAAEIAEIQPDLVGLQEVAMWRTGETSVEPLYGIRPKASNVRYDFLELLLAELDAAGRHYEAVVIQEQFDFEAPADENQLAGDGF
ncbi:MAG TPA: hypothetical protein VD838_05175, partial [Anaeromyxobacteraceae bacterium]|nr:hypothetical protein [Anaeromyxobacteraceae bacterium]